ncbi:DUF1127 domain-containing protein [Loktanella sp. SALINAS62]|uniref:DUF1127 domain-containing protein n=1 Tax=Loktanella sp. SALINAS62 TaxID=2706124 RepID=UPI001B8B10C8|nr:DUF1127 domain-containing protein [Loktanella sp. SALINAS62]MBS1303831.1 DUF1127 domain-containing protein [Loktanella sp. SALINAS62]
MAYTNTNTAPTLNQRFAGMRAQIAEAAAKRRVYRTTLTELSALSNRELADLGIARSMIKGIAIEAAYGK